MQVTDEMIEKAAEAFSKATAWYPDNDVYGAVTEWFRLDAQDAVDFGVLKEPKWDGISDIRGMQHEWYVAAVVKEPMRAALTAALSEKRAVEVKAPEDWELVPKSAIMWLIGAGPDAYGNWFDKPEGAPAFWWRTHFNKLRADAAKLRSALVDAPAVEPVAWQRLTDSFGWQLVNAEDLEHYRAKGAKLRPLYTSPPLSREGEGSAGWTHVQSFHRYPYVVEKIGGEWHLRMHDAQTAGVSRTISKHPTHQSALAATRSGSVTTAKGCAE